MKKNYTGFLYFFISLLFVVLAATSAAAQEGPQPVGFAEVGGGLDSYSGHGFFFIDGEGCLLGWCLGLRAGVPTETSKKENAYVQTVNIYGGFHLINMVDGLDRAAWRIMGGVASFPLPDTDEWNYDDVRTGEAWTDLALRLGWIEFGGKFGRRWFPKEVAPHVFLWNAEGRLYPAQMLSFGARIGSPELPRITLENNNFVHPGHQVDFTLGIGQPYWGFWGVELYGGFQPQDGSGHFGFRLHLRLPYKPEWEDAKREKPKKQKIQPPIEPPGGGRPRR